MFLIKETSKDSFLYSWTLSKDKHCRPVQVPFRCLIKFYSKFQCLPLTSARDVDAPPDLSFVQHSRTLRTVALVKLTETYYLFYIIIEHI